MRLSLLHYLSSLHFNATNTHLISIQQKHDSHFFKCEWRTTSVYLFLSFPTFYLCMSLFIYVFVSLCPCVCVCVCVCVSLVFVIVYIFIALYGLSLLPLSLLIRPSLLLSVFVRLSLSLFVCLPFSVCPSLYFSL
jgi:hypothetical protein